MLVLKVYEWAYLYTLDQNFLSYDVLRRLQRIQGFETREA
jgi:hypothetical protein